MSVVSIDPKGIREFRDQLSAFESGVEDLKEINTLGARLVEREAEKRVTVKSGRLKASIRSTGQSANGVIRAGLSTVPYAGVQNYGWPERGIRATEFLTGAAEDVTPDVLILYGMWVEELIEKYGLD